MNSNSVKLMIDVYGTSYYTFVLIGDAALEFKQQDVSNNTEFYQNIGSYDIWYLLVPWPLVFVGQGRDYRISECELTARQISAHDKDLIYILEAAANPNFVDDSLNLVPLNPEFPIPRFMSQSCTTHSLGSKRTGSHL